MKAQSSQFEQLNFSRQNREHERIPEPAQSKNDLFSSLPLYCPFGQPAFEYCCEETCTENAVRCKDENCKCGLVNHSQCSATQKVQRFHSKINGKIKSDIDGEVETMEANVDRIVDKISTMLDQIKGPKGLKTFGLNKNEENLKDMITNHFDTQAPTQSRFILSGSEIFRFKSEQKQADKVWLNYSIQKYKNIVQETKNFIEPLFKELERTLENIHYKKSQERMSCSQLHKAFFDSAIFKSENMGFLTEDLDFVLKPLTENLTISSINKIFGFQNKSPNESKNSNRSTNSNILFPPLQVGQSIKNIWDQFIKNCLGKSNLLFVVQNQCGKKLAVYTPCALTLGENWTTDQSEKTLFYSIDNKHLQRLKQSKSGLRLTQNNLEIGKASFNDNQSNFFLKQKANGFSFVFRDDEPSVNVEFNHSQIVQTAYSKLNDTNSTGKPGLFETVNNLQLDSYIKINGKPPGGLFKTLPGVTVTIMDVYEIKLDEKISQDIETKTRVLSNSSTNTQPKISTKSHENIYTYQTRKY